MKPEEQAHELVQQIMPILAGHCPGVQGAVLADLVAMHLAGHVMVHHGDEAETLRKTRELRNTLLTQFVITIERLIPVNAAMMGAPHDPILPEEEGLEVS